MNLSYVLIVFLLPAFLFFSNIGAAQNQDSLLTKSQNDRWISEFKKIPSIELQFEAIKNKIQSDAHYTIEKSNNTVEINIRASQGTGCFECKILFLLSFQKDSFSLEPNEYPETNEILNLISGKDIDEIFVYDKKSTYQIFGSKAVYNCGSMILLSKNRKIKRKIKRISSQS